MLSAYTTRRSMDLALCKHAYHANRRYKGYKKRHGARLFLYFRVFASQSSPERNLCSRSWRYTWKHKYPFKRTTEQAVQRIYSVYEIVDAEICLPFNRTVVASIVSELLINYGCVTSRCQGLFPPTQFKREKPWGRGWEIVSRSFKED